MPLNYGNIIGLLSDNLKKRKSVFPVSRRKLSKWGLNLNLPYGGDTVIYTGSMYQLVPYIEASVKMMKTFEKKGSDGLLKLGRTVNKFINVSKFTSFVTKSQLKPYFAILETIGKLLQKAGIKFGYLYQDELYSGTLIYDYGMDDIFFEHAFKVYKLLKSKKIKTVITVDPHTTDIFKHVYPKFIDDFSRFEIKSYLEVLYESGLTPKRGIEKTVSIHDSCVYARYLNMIDEPRSLLQKGEVKIIEPENSGKMTLCCGGPLESLSPQKSSFIAKKRVEQFEKLEVSEVVVMCPLCLTNLNQHSGNNIKFTDISSYLKEIYL